MAGPRLDPVTGKFLPGTKKAETEETPAPAPDAPAETPTPQKATTRFAVNLPEGYASDEVRTAYGMPRVTTIECAPGYVVILGGTSPSAMDKLTGPFPRGCDLRRVPVNSNLVDERLFNVAEAPDGNRYLVDSLGQPLLFESLEHLKQRRKLHRDYQDRRHGGTPLGQEAEARERALKTTPNLVVTDSTR